MFRAEFVVTEKCNLRCPYCYISHKDSMMTFETFERHKKLLPIVLESYGCREYNVTLFGGEPLLNFDLIKQILPVFAADDKCKSISMPTNGLLLNSEIMRVLYYYKVNISWSFDGLWHYNSGDMPMFKAIREQFLPSHTCKAMISPRRKYTLSQNYLWFIKEMNMYSPDFTLVRDDVWDKKEVALYKEEVKTFADEVISVNESVSLRMGILSLPSPFSLYILDTIVGRKHGKRSFGCFAGCHGAAFMPDGVVYPCARYGTLRKSPLFNIQGGSFPVNINRYLDPKNTNPCTFDRCKECELSTYCNAGCTFSQEGIEFGPLTSICEMLKETYRQSFRIVDKLCCHSVFRDKFKEFLRERIC